MGKNNNFKWGESDNNRLRRLTERYNQHIETLTEKGVSLEVLPQRLNFDVEKNNIQSQKELQRRLEDLKTFVSSKGEISTENDKLYDFEVSHFYNLQKRRNEEIEKYAELLRQTKVDTPLGKRSITEVASTINMPKVGNYNPNKKSRREFQKKIDQLNAQLDREYDYKMRKQMQDNYILACENELNPFGRQLNKIINTMSPDEFWNYYIANFENVSFEFIYGSGEAYTRGDQIFQNWVEILDYQEDEISEFDDDFANFDYYENDE